MTRRRHWMGAVLLGAALAAAVAPVHAQRMGRGMRDGAGPQHGRMSPEERQRMREEMNAMHRQMHPGGNAAPAPGPRGGQLSPEERERLRREMQEANRAIDRRR